MLLAASGQTAVNSGYLKMDDSALLWQGSSARFMCSPEASRGSL
jgi:hypothetical protein